MVGLREQLQRPAGAAGGLRVGRGGRPAGGGGFPVPGNQAGRLPPLHRGHLPGLVRRRLVSGNFRQRDSSPKLLKNCYVFNSDTDCLTRSQMWVNSSACLTSLLVLTLAALWQLLHCRNKSHISVDWD